MRIFENIAVGTNLCTRWDLKTALRYIRKIGFHGATPLADWPHAYVLNLTPAWIKEIRDVLQETGLFVASVNGFTAVGFAYFNEKEKELKSRVPKTKQYFGPIFSDSEAWRREWKVNYTKKVIDFAEAIGAGNVSIGSGYLPEGADRETAWKWMREAIKECVEYAERKGVNVNIEYEPYLLVGSQEDADRILSEIPSPNFGLNFDIGHSFVCGENVVDQIWRFRGRIYGVDIEDIGVDKSGRRIHKHLIPGTGVMPLFEIMCAFVESGYKGKYTLELYSQAHRPIKAMSESKKYLKDMEKTSPF